jgi:hypothetical protein
MRLHLLPTGVTTVTAEADAAVLRAVRLLAVYMPRAMAEKNKGDAR